MIILPDHPFLRTERQSGIIGNKIVFLRDTFHRSAVVPWLISSEHLRRGKRTTRVSRRFIEDRPIDRSIAGYDNAKERWVWPLLEVLSSSVTKGQSKRVVIKLNPCWNRAPPRFDICPRNSIVILDR